MYPVRIDTPALPVASPVEDLNDPALYFNRELSLLEFHRRVLAQARDLDVPLLERLRFLAICSTNLDEFFEIRVSGLKQQIEYGVSQLGPDGLTAQETLQRISALAHGLVEEQYRILNAELLPALEGEGIRLLKRSDWSPEQQAWTREHFQEDVLPILTPIALDPAHPFPLVLNKGLSFAISLEGKDAFGRLSGRAVLQVPRSLPRVTAVPAEIAGGPYDFVLLSSVLHAYVGEVFPGMELLRCSQFRVTRDSDLWIDEEEAENLLLALKGELSSRNFGDPVRLEVAENITPEMSDYLLARTRLSKDDLYRVEGPVNLHRLSTLYDLVDRPELKYKPFVPATPRAVSSEEDLFAAIREGDILLHHPYDSFAPVVELVRQAAVDPAVLAVRQTLYRTDAGSPLVQALIDAARAGKEVTAVIELRARFDEERNIDLATRLQAVGANVVYGIVGYKTHCKMLLVVRRDLDGLRRYVHLGTGNYHARTARAYTDFGLLTCDEDLGADVNQLFLQLTGLGQVPRLTKLCQAPFSMARRMLELIDGETERARRGEPARLVAKVNSLSDAQMIRALYRASQAGVQVDLVVRGICCLRPGVPGVSDNIRVRSIVGRFLEHHRIFYFLAGGEELVYLSSADWMGRNLYRRVEAAFPIEDPRLKARVISEGLEYTLEDNCQAWLLGPDGTYTRLSPAGAARCSAQERSLARGAGAETG
jgi:polyphosphate kinase